MKLLSRTLLVAYLAMLLWLVLFKFSIDFSSVLLDYQAKGLNLIPFAGALQGDWGEMVDNFVVFIPFGLLLSVNFKQAMFRQKLSLIFFSSLAVEMIQYILAIGVADITDVITNTLGGLFGLLFYDASRRQDEREAQDQWMVPVIAILLVTVMLLRFFVFRVRY